MPIASKSELRKAAEQLSQNDPKLEPIIARAGLAKFEPHTDYYGALVNSIIGQQLSVKAATSIKQRFRNLYDNAMPTPEQILETEVAELRAVGFSGAKAAYVNDLAQHILDGKVDFATLNKLSNDEIIQELTDVKGIGEWTVHMFLMFCMGRLDVLPTGDLGVRSGIRQLYGFNDLPSPTEIRTIAINNQWNPYESVASWYVWEYLDNKPN